MSYRVRLQPAALEDLDAAYRYAAERAPNTAARWFCRFYEALQSLESNPERCSLAPEDDRSERELRQFLFGMRQHVFRAVFTIQDRTVWIVRIRHAAREPLTRSELGEDDS